MEKTHDEIMQGLKDDLLDINEQVRVIQAKADAENRDLLEDEDTLIQSMFAKFEQTEEEIERRERINAMNQRLLKAEPRQSAPEPMAAAAPRRRGPNIEMPTDKGKWGFRDFGEFAASVAMANNRVNGNVDPRLRDIRNAPSTYGNEGSGADGGFAVPPDFRTAIMETVLGEASLLGRTDQMQTTSNSITFPKDETTPWQTTGGFQVYWEGENDLLTQSKMQLKEETVKLNKLSCLVPVTEELLTDAASLNG